MAHGGNRWAGSTRQAHDLLAADYARRGLPEDRTPRRSPSRPDPEHQRDQDSHGGDNEEYAWHANFEKRRTRTVRSGNRSYRVRGLTLTNWPAQRRFPFRKTKIDRLPVVPRSPAGNQHATTIDINMVGLQQRNSHF